MLVQLKCNAAHFLPCMSVEGGEGVSGPLEALNSVGVSGEWVFLHLKLAQLPVAALLIDLWRARPVLTYDASAVAALLVNIHGMNCKGRVK